MRFAVRSHEPENRNVSLAQAGAGFVLTVLVMAGIAGTVFYFSRTWTPSPRHRHFTADAL